jgi:hypothetical protein
MDRQQDVQQAQPRAQRDEAYFRQTIASVTSAEQLVSDRKLLGIVLGAFGLDADINNRFFIRKVLEEGVTSQGALANRLANKSYREMTEALGFGDQGSSRTSEPGFADKILAAYNSRQFEVAVGEKSNTLRLALNAERELPQLATKQGSEDTKWFTVMGSPPLRKVFETAFGLPDSFVSIDIDQQLGVFKARAERFLGTSSIDALSDPQLLDRLIRRYLALSGSDAPAATQRGSAALQILQAGTEGTRGSATVLRLLS